MKTILRAILASALFGAPQASAQDAGWMPDAWQAGGFVGVAPKYEGSNDYEAIGFPIVAPASLGGGEDGFVQFKGPDDLRFRVIRRGGFEAGPLAGWRFDREQDDAKRLRGLGDVDGGLVLGGYVGYRLGSLMPFLSYHQGVGGDDTGAIFRFGSEFRTHILGGVLATATVGATYADDDYTDAYFGVTPRQSVNSLAGLPTYDGDAGVKDVYFGFSTDIPVGERWSLKLSTRYSHLVGDAADSPIVEEESQFFGGAGVTYRFSFK
jgi:outer membrane protein